MLKLKEMCTVRSEDRVYIQCELEGLAPKQRTVSSLLKETQLLHTRAYMNEHEIPVQTLTVQENDYLYLIFILPLFEYPVTLFIEQHGEDGSSLDLVKKQISPFMVKWQSRFNYRFNKRNAYSLRNIESSLIGNQGVFALESVVEDPAVVLLNLKQERKNHDDKLLVRFVYHVDSTIEPQDLDVAFYSPEGEKIDCKPLVTGCLHANTQVPTGINYTRITFSLFIHEHDVGMICSVYNKINGCASAFTLTHQQVVKGKESHYLQTIHAGNDDFYGGQWYNDHIPDPVRIQRQLHRTFEYNPLISIVVPIYKTKPEYLAKTIKSVQNQTYSNWELICANASPEDKGVNEVLSTAAKQDSRVVIVNLEDNEGITLNTEKGIDAAHGEFVAFLDHDDLLSPDALYSYVHQLNKDPHIDVFYSDEDKVNEEGWHFDPFLKPDFSAYYLRENNYVCHFLMVRNSLLDTIPHRDKSYDGAQDHDLILRLSEKTNHICHVPRVLYTWRVTPQSTASNADAKPYATIAAQKAIEEHLERVDIKGEVVETGMPCRFHVHYAVKQNPLVSIIIPNKDQADLIKRCIDSIEEKTTYENYEILVVENNSEKEETFKLYDELSKKYANLTVLKYKDKFNYAKINNFAAQQARGEYFLFLNNDTEVITKDWITSMLGICQSGPVGAVGAKLLYPDNTIQHAGVAISEMHPLHLFVGMDRNDPGYFYMPQSSREVSSVTAACLLTPKAVFEEVGGFDSKFEVAFNDVDFCLKIREAGYLIIYDAEAELIHYESVSRGFENTLEKNIRFNREYDNLQHRWESLRLLGDPYHNKHVSAFSNHWRLGWSILPEDWV